ncbi:MAG: DNA-binding transcriptional LysR family regulator [Alphaproteobacteria bacterium]|jgi:DNA-binding transcriptional LysR family regulator
MRHLMTFRYVDEVAKTGSMRMASEILSITPSALTRRIQSLEDELGEPIFERLTKGVRLTAAGTVLIAHIRNQLSDMERVKSHISDLAGVRRGHISIACSQGVLAHFVAPQINAYRRSHPGVTFSVIARDRSAAEQALHDYSADLALIFEPIRLVDLKTISTSPQSICVIMSSRHMLAKKHKLRLKDCVDYPVALPTRPYGTRYLIEKASARLGIEFSPAVETDSFDFLRNLPSSTDVISFHTRLGLPRKKVHNGMVHRSIDKRDLPAGTLSLVQLNERNLPVATQKFGLQLAQSLKG